MERITISLEGDLAESFDRLVAARGYGTRSEAVRDLIRTELERDREDRDVDGHCVGNLSYVYNHHERELGERIMGLQHAHHDLCVSTMHAHLDHDSCLETVILRGPTREVRRFADAVISERGVRHGTLNLVTVDIGHSHRHGHGHSHRHLKPRE